MKLVGYLLRIAENKGVASDMSLKYPKDYMILVNPKEDVHKRSFLVTRHRDSVILQEQWKPIQEVIDASFQEEYEVEVCLGAEIS